MQHCGDVEAAYAAFREAVEILSPDVSPYAAPATTSGAMLNLSSALVSIGRPKSALEYVRGCLQELQQGGELLASLCEPMQRSARLQHTNPDGIADEIEECREAAVCLPREQVAMVTVAWQYLAEASDPNPDPTGCGVTPGAGKTEPLPTRAGPHCDGRGRGDTGGPDRIQVPSFVLSALP